MCEDLKKRIAERRNDSTPLTQAQEARIDCALDLYAAAASIVYDFEPRPNAAPLTEAENTRRLCVTGARAESYVALLRWLNELLKCKYDRVYISHEETIAAWKRLFEWFVRDGIRPPIQHWNGVETVALPFEVVHDRVMGTYRDVMAFRKGIMLKARGGVK